MIEGEGVTEFKDTKQRRGKKVRRIKIGRVIIVVLLFAILLFSLLWVAANGIRGIIVKYTANVDSLLPATISQQLNIEGVLIKKELLILAPYNGEVKFTITDGQRVKVGTIFADLTVNSMDATTGTIKHSIKSPASGVLCSHIDGLETVLDPGALDIIEIPTLDKIQKDGREMSGLVEKGQPVAKVVDNLSPIYLHTVIPEGEVKRFEEQKQDTIYMKWQGHTIELRLHKVNTGSQPGVIFLVKKYPDNFIHKRQIEMQLTTENLEGLLVNEQSLVLKDGQEGIFQVWKGLVRWIPVEITGRLKDQVSVKGKDIEPGIRYVVNPTLVREGDRL